MNKHRKMNLVPSLFIIAIAFVVVLLLENNYSNDLKAENELKLRQNASQYSSLISDEMKNQKIYMESTGKLMSKILGQTPDKTSKENINIIRNVFKNKQLSSNLIHSLYFVYETTGDKINGNGLMKQSDLNGYSRTRDWYKMARDSREPVLTDVYKDTNSKKSCITISYPIYKNEDFIGVVSCDIFVEDIGNYFVDDLNKKYYDIYLLSPTGQIITKPEENKLDISINEMFKKYFSNNSSEKIELEENHFYPFDNFYFGQHGSIHTENLKGEKIYGYHSNIDEFDWKLFVFNDPTILNAKLQNHLFKIRIFGFFACIIALIIVNYLVNRSYNINNITGFKSRQKLLKDIKKKSKSSNKATILMIAIKNINDINEQYGNDTADLLINNYANHIKGIFSDKATIYSASESKFILLFKEIEKEQIFNSVEKHLMDLKYKEFAIDKHRVATKSFIALIDFNKEEMENANVTIPKIEKIIRNLKYNNDQILATSLEELSQKMDEDYKKLIYLKKAIEQDRLMPFFQPLLDIKTKEIIKYEVLMRIKQGEDYLAPYPFILIAEKNNLIEEIDIKILEKALLYKNKIDKDDKLVFSFNLSGKVTNSTKYLNKANSIIDKYGIKHENIIFEITETENIENLNKFISIIKDFKKSNYEFSIDDFGVGFSSISYLKNVPADYIKIDGSFIKDINEKEENLYLVKSIVNMAKAFNLKTVAEFVESEEILEVVDSLGVDYAQGYYIDKPNKEIKNV